MNLSNKDIYLQYALSQFLPFGEVRRGSSFNAYNSMKAYSYNGERYGYYGYDASGERTYKYDMYSAGSWTNQTGGMNVSLQIDKMMLYPNGYLNMNQNGEYTKHYYADALCIASKIGNGFSQNLCYEANQIGDDIDPNYLEDRRDKQYDEMMEELTELINGNQITDINPIPYPEANLCNLSGSGIETALFFYHPDHLGSVDLITDRYGNVVDSMSFDAWGNRRNYQDWEQKDNSVHLIDRGFTMHQHLDSFNLINMGGRVYDPVVAQFLSPDPYVQAPDNTQNLNRYNYCYNSPLMYKDPTGEFIITFLVNAIAGAIRKEGFFNQGFEAIGNQFKIFGGLFTSDKNKNGWAQIGEVVNRFTWQFAQTSVGYFFNQFMNTFAGVSNVDYSNGATVINSRWINGAVTLGSFISGDASLAADPNNSLFQHEYGHYLQSQYMGPAYLSRVGIPSLFGALGKNTHDIQVYEQDANYRAFVYFNKRVEGFYQTEEEFWTNFYNGTEKGWNFVNNPLDLTHENIRGTYYDYKNPEHLSQVNSWRLKAEWYEYAWGTVDPFSNALFIGSGNHIYNNPRRP